MKLSLVMLLGLISTSFALASGGDEAPKQTIISKSCVLVIDQYEDKIGKNGVKKIQKKIEKNGWIVTDDYAVAKQSPEYFTASGSSEYHRVNSKVEISEDIDLARFVNGEFVERFGHKSISVSGRNLFIKRKYRKELVEFINRYRCEKEN